MSVTHFYYNIAIVISSEYHGFLKMKIQSGTAKHLALISSEYCDNVLKPCIKDNSTIQYGFFTSM